MNDQVDLTISCVLYNTDPAEVDRMVEQVASIPLRTHLYIVDNSPGLAAGHSTDKNVTRIVTGANLGYGRAHNIGIREARGRSRFHLISNTDIVFNGDDIPKLIDVLVSSPDVGLVAPRVRYPNGDIQHLCRLLPYPSDLIARGFFSRSRWGKRRNDLYELKQWNYDEDRDIPFLSGCFMLTRHDILENLNGFDERFFMYCEDLDFSRRINSVSRTLFTPRVEITHLYRTKLVRNLRIKRYLMVSAIRYFLKWGWWSDAHRATVNARTLASLGLSSAREQ